MKEYFVICFHIFLVKYAIFMFFAEFFFYEQIVIYRQNTYIFLQSALAKGLKIYGGIFTSFEIGYSKSETSLKASRKHYLV